MKWNYAQCNPNWHLHQISNVPERENSSESELKSDLMLMWRTRQTKLFNTSINKTLSHINVGSVSQSIVQSEFWVVSKAGFEALHIHLKTPPWQRMYGSLDFPSEGCGDPASPRCPLSLHISISLWVHTTVQHVTKQDKEIASWFRYSNHASTSSQTLLFIDEEQGSVMWTCVDSNVLKYLGVNV